VAVKPLESQKTLDITGKGCANNFS